jgi:solute:Na+ symporter, SSS family
MVQIYVGFVALAGNLLVAVVVTLIVRRMKVSNGEDHTTGEDYHVDEHDENLRPIAAAH